jgi:hypothetical protein
MSVDGTFDTCGHFVDKASRCAFGCNFYRIPDRDP